MTKRYSKTACTNLRHVSSMKIDRTQWKALSGGAVGYSSIQVFFVVVLVENMSYNINLSLWHKVSDNHCENN